MKYICTKCKNGLNEQKGCVFCDDFKRNYVSIKDDAPTVSAKAILLRALNTVGDDLAKLEIECGANKRYDAALSREIQVLAKSLTLISDSIRKLEDEKEAERELTFSENVLLFQEYLAEQPVMLQKQCMTKLVEQFGNGANLKVG